MFYILDPKNEIEIVIAHATTEKGIEKGIAIVTGIATGNVKESNGNEREKSESGIGKENENGNNVNESERGTGTGNARGMKPGRPKGRFSESVKKRKRPRREKRMKGEPEKRMQLIRNV